MISGGGVDEALSRLGVEVVVELSEQEMLGHGLLAACCILSCIAIVAGRKQPRSAIRGG